MEILVRRKIFTDESTIGEVYVNGIFECFCLEDKDRGLTKTDSLPLIAQHKVYGKTAIPTGRYQVALTFSNRFQKYMPLVVGVPGFEGVRIHPGNKAADTEGCLLVGQEKGPNIIGKSRLAFEALMRKIKAVEKKEKIYITYTK